MESSEGGTGRESFNQKLKRAEDVMMAGSKVRSNEGRVMVGKGGSGDSRFCLQTSPLTVPQPQYP